MIDAILLYGSRARGDGDQGSDTDLLGVTKFGKIRKPYDQSGVSFHIYPEVWLRSSAAGGSIFLLHLVSEAKVIFDPNFVFSEIRSAFKYKESYVEEIEVGCRVISALRYIKGIEFTNRLRRRYFWGLRTALMAAGAQKRTPCFSGSSLEKMSEILGLEEHIKAREIASFVECKEFAEKVLEYCRAEANFSDFEDREENLRALLAKSGMASLVGAEILYGD